MRILAWVGALVGLSALPSIAQGNGVSIYFVDTEGGAATLIVTPTGESVLIDAGNPGERDAGRIHKVATQVAGLKQIDHFIATHWHLDHYGGVGPLSKLMPIAKFYDHGIPAMTIDDPNNFPKLIAAYKEASKGASVALKAGDVVALKDAPGGVTLRLRCIISNQEPVAERPNARPNPVAGEFKAKDKDTSDNANSAGFVLQYGDFRFLDLGDLTWNTEQKLVEPSNRIGRVDVYQVTHHGLNISSNPTLVKSADPRVAIFNNGAKKGGHPEVMSTLRALPGIEGIWMMHRNVTSTAADNAKPEMTANKDEACQGEFIVLKVAADGKSYTVQIGAGGAPVKYNTRERRRAN